jgi:lysophospholipase
VGASAPLVSIPEAPAPAGAVAEWFEGAGGARLRAALFTPEGAPKGSVVVSPGRTEPIEKYFETVAELNRRGFVALVHDWRGQGLSLRALPDRLMGHAEGYQPFLDDYRALLDAYAARLPRPWIALGHSMGGCLTLLALVKGEGRFSAAALSAPMLTLSLGPVPKSGALAAVAMMKMMGRAGANALPLYDPLADRFEEDRLTHDRTRYLRHKAQLNACPDLALGAPTWGWLDFAFSAIAAIEAPGALERVQIPVLLMAAGQDRLVLSLGAKAAAGRLLHGRFEEVADAYHELLVETDERRARFWAAFDQLIEPIISPPA